MDPCTLFAVGMIAITFFILGCNQEKKKLKDPERGPKLDSLNYII